MYTVKKTSEIVGLPISSLHFYEKEGLVIPIRKENNYRYYSEADIEQLKMLVVLKASNLSLDEVRFLINKYAQQEITSQKIAECQQFFLNKKSELEAEIMACEKAIRTINRLPIMRADNQQRNVYEMKDETDEVISSLYDAINT